MRDVLAEIWSTVRRNKLRTALTGFAVAWGIFMIIFLLGAGNGLINAQKVQRDRFLDNSMMVGPGYTSKAYDGLQEGRRITLNDKDKDLTDKSYKQYIEDTGAELQQNSVTLTKEANYVSVTLSGVYPNDVKINKKEMLYGRFINQIDIEQSRKSLVLSEADAKELLPGDVSNLVGQYVDVGDMAFRVVGHLRGRQKRHEQGSVHPVHHIPHHIQQRRRGWQHSFLVPWS